MGHKNAINLPRCHLIVLLYCTVLYCTVLYCTVLYSLQPIQSNTTIFIINKIMFLHKFATCFDK